MKRTYLMLLFAVLGFNSYTQKTLTAEYYANFINVNDAQKNLSMLASNAYEGRETGKPGAQKAAMYLATEFKRLGLLAAVNNSYFMNVPFLQNTRNFTTFSVNERSFAYGKDFLSLTYFPLKDINVSDIVFVGYGSEREVGNTDLTGKVLIWINEDMPEPGKITDTGYFLNEKRNKTLEYLQSKKPAVIFGANPGTQEAIQLYGSGFPCTTLSLHPDSCTSSSPVFPNAPLYFVTNELANELVRKSGKTYMDFRAASAASPAATTIIKSQVIIHPTDDRKALMGAEILGYIPGTDLKEEVVVISAHYDHIGMLTDQSVQDKVYNGADDDGSGSIALIEIARAFIKAKKEGHGPRRSILILAHVGEEKGLLGSAYYVDHPVFPLANTVANLQMDMIGRVGNDYIGSPDSNHVYIVGSSRISNELHNINEQMNGLTRLKLDYIDDGPNDPGSTFTRSDHYNFALHGIPVIFYFDGGHNDYHQVGDEVSKINFKLLVRRTQLVFYTAWELANRNNRPAIDREMKK